MYGVYFDYFFFFFVDLWRVLFYIELLGWYCFYRIFVVCFKIEKVWCGLLILLDEVLLFLILLFECNFSLVEEFWIMMCRFFYEFRFVIYLMYIYIYSCYIIILKYYCILLNFYLFWVNVGKCSYICWMVSRCFFFWGDKVVCLLFRFIIFKSNWSGFLVLWLKKLLLYSFNYK